MTGVDIVCYSDFIRCKLLVVFVQIKKGGQRMAAIIKIENLYKVYSVGKEKVVALGGINLQIEK